MNCSCFLVLIVILSWVQTRQGEAPAEPETSAQAAVATKPKAKRRQTLSLRGRVVWMNEALARRHGVRTVPESAERILALETSDGQLHPLVEDIRGRAFRRDKRLRQRDVELLVRRHPDSPMIQIIRVFAVQQHGKFELDYWCEICAISMVELKVCDCCQGPIELRSRKVKKSRESRANGPEPEVK